jgi:hypothetical protein
MPQRSTRPLAAVLTLLLTASLATACDGMDTALDCAKVAARIAGDVQDLQSTATNIGQLSERGRREDTAASLAKLRKDLQQVGGGSGADVRKAVEGLSAALGSAEERARTGKEPDGTALADAAGRLSVACTTG